ncbi:sugar transferase [Pseudooceanicola batsensis HTCC2597]|uniref:Sugar transferase n=1 Tax=Pseudooceanicola batsensis (strain ATCC BAA-863 / DSM 15984 / KCTC 12145 / HTCC2597) TaxID=252305 RepID=A3TST7_PSEBH|nr:glycosyltransferase family 2 protein [Pseudooceanicola batsensis]EAQ04714.1 sugar transferase [Pseudooceanicola batsensis HTCC2597]
MNVSPQLQKALRDRAARRGPVRRVSVVVPFLNEAETLEVLHQRITATLAGLGPAYEIILVDDGSEDGGELIAEALAETDAHVRVIRFTRNFGKAAALSAGIAEARGDVIVTMDADLQDDPKEIGRFLAKLDEGYDVVSGWKQTRHDPVGKTLPSKIFNRMTARLFDVDLHDINCGFKAYSRRAARHLNLYGELHRFTPALLHAAGYRVAEIAVEHHPRAHGQSKYGTRRLIKGLLDIATVKLVTRYQSRPLHFFAMLGLPLLLVGLAFISYLSALWILDMGPIGNRPLLLIGILFTVTGTQVLGVGLVAELLQAAGLRERDKYVIDQRFGESDAAPAVIEEVRP